MARTRQTGHTAERSIESLIARANNMLLDPRSYDRPRNMPPLPTMLPNASGPHPALRLAPEPPTFSTRDRWLLAAIGVASSFLVAVVILAVMVVRSRNVEPVTSPPTPSLAVAKPAPAPIPPPVVQAVPTPAPNPQAAPAPTVTPAPTPAPVLAAAPANGDQKVVKPKPKARAKVKAKLTKAKTKAKKSFR